MPLYKVSVWRDEDQNNDINHFHDSLIQTISAASMAVALIGGDNAKVNYPINMKPGNVVMFEVKESIYPIIMIRRIS